MRCLLAVCRFLLGLTALHAGASPVAAPPPLERGFRILRASTPDEYSARASNFDLAEDRRGVLYVGNAAEKEERESYEHRMPPAWLEALAPLGTDWPKPFLEIAPALVVAFKKDYEIVKGERLNSYYASESIGIACGFLIAAIHDAGLVTLTHTPSPMSFLGEILAAAPGEKAYLLLPVGYPAATATVPDIQRKPLSQVVTWIRESAPESP